MQQPLLLRLLAGALACLLPAPRVRPPLAGGRASILEPTSASPTRFFEASRPPAAPRARGARADSDPARDGRLGRDEAAAPIVSGTS